MHACMHVHACMYACITVLPVFLKRTRLPPFLNMDPPIYSDFFIMSYAALPTLICITTDSVHDKGT